MRGIEKDLRNYLKMNGRRLNKDVIVHSIEEDSDEFINNILRVIMDEVDSSVDGVSLDRVKELLSYIQTALDISCDVDRKALVRKLSKLDIKLDCIRVEQKKKFKDIKKANTKLDKISDEVDLIKEQVSDRETKKYDFMNYLIKEVQNIQYVECVLMKIPNLVNIRDKNHFSLFQNTVGYYLEAIRKGDLKEEYYYNNILSLFLGQKSFNITDEDKRSILNQLSKTIHSLNKNRDRNYKDKMRKIQHLIVSIKGEDTKKVEIEAIAEKYDIPVFFDKSILDEVRGIPTSHCSRRIDSSYIVTIDGDGTVEIDDGLSCRKLENGNYLLGVHIASVLGYFPYESRIVREAIHRNQSIYLPKKYQSKDNDFQKIIPMFPYEFSTYKGSLVEGERRLARSYYFEIARDGSIVDEKYLKSIVVNQKKMSFEEVDSILKRGVEDISLLRTVEDLQSVSELLDKQYKVDPLYDEMKNTMNDYSDLKVNKVGAQGIIYNAMLLTGNRVADYFAKNGYPCLYRVHEVESSKNKRVEEMLKDLTKSYGGEQYQQINQLMKGIYPSGWYDVEGRHFGLGVDHYCHCTSPIRRAADIVVEHALEICYDKNPSDKELTLLEKEIDYRMNEINAKEEPIDWFVREYKKTYQRRR